MQRTFLILIWLTFSLCCKSLTEAHNYKVELKHFYGSEGFTVHYFVNQNSIKVRYNCDFENCKDKLIYQTKLDRQKSTNFYSFLTSTNFDTLKSDYERNGFDGRYTTVKISGDSFKSKTINLVRFEHPIIEQLINEEDLLIPEIKYRLYSHKYKK